MPPMRHDASRSASVNSDHGARRDRLLRREVDGVELPSNDAKNQRAPSRTAFSVSGSFTASKKCSLRVARALCPLASSSTSMRRAVAAQRAELAAAGRIDQRAAADDDLVDEWRVSRSTTDTEVAGS